MVEIKLHEEACRGCRMCVDICPTKVFAFDEEKWLCVVEHQDDCIACLSCAYLCPSGAIRQENHHVVKNFYRDLAFCAKMEKFI